MWCSFFVKMYFSFREIIFFVRPLKYANVTNILDLRYFCQHNPLFYHLNLIRNHKTVEEIIQDRKTEKIRSKPIPHAKLSKPIHFHIPVIKTLIDLIQW